MTQHTTQETTLLNKFSRIAGVLALATVLTPQAACGTISKFTPGHKDQSDVTWPGQVNIPHAIPKDLSQIAPTTNCPSSTLIPTTPNQPENGLRVATSRL